MSAHIWRDGRLLGFDGVEWLTWLVAVAVIGFHNDPPQVRLQSERGMQVVQVTRERGRHRHPQQGEAR